MPPPESVPPSSHDTSRLFDAGDLKSNLKRRVVRGGTATLSAQIVNFLITIGSLAVLGRLLSPDDFGLIGMALVVTGLVRQFSNMGLSQATVQREDITPWQVSNLFWINVAVGCLMAGICAALAPVLVWFYHEPRVLGVTIALAGAMAVNGLAIQHQALLQRQMRFHRLSIISVLSVAGAALLAIATARWLGYWSLVVQNYALSIILVVGVWSSARWVPHLPRRRVQTRQLAIFGGNLTLVNIGDYLRNNIDRLLIGRMFGPDALGQYTRAATFVQLPQSQIMPPTTAVALPTFSRLASEPQKYRHNFLLLFSMLGLLLTPAVALMIPCGDWIIRLVLGEQWREAGWIFQAMSPLMLVQVFNTALSWIFITRDQTGAYLRWSLVNSAVSLLAIIIGLYWGPIGVALSYSVTGFVIRTPYLFYCVSRIGVLSVKDLCRAMLPAVCLGISVLAVTLPIRLYWGFERPMTGLALATTAAVVMVAWQSALIPVYRSRLTFIRQFVSSYRSR